MNGDSGNRFVGLVWNIDSEADAARHVRSKLDRVTKAWRQTDLGAVILCSEAAGSYASIKDAALGMSSPLAVSPRERRTYGPAALLAKLTDSASAEAGLRDIGAIAAPFAAAWTDRRSGALDAATDAYGIGQLFYLQTEIATAVSNSALTLGALFGCALDLQALTGFGLFGAFQESDSPFEGVRKLPANHGLHIVRGRCALVSRQERAPRANANANAANSIDQLAGGMRDIVAEMSDAIPDADLQLSGGLDSRLILAALPAEHRRRHRAVTIGGPDSADVAVAGAIAARLGMRHQISGLSDADDLDAEAFAALVTKAARGFDCAANPIDKLSLILPDSAIRCDAWFNGQNGEGLRGFYYAGQSLNARPSEGMARSLLSWRLESNDLADPQIFAEPYKTRRAEAEARAVKRLLGLGETWSQALDNFYLYERMQRWAGIGLDNNTNKRTYLCPFFDPRFVEAALAAPAEQKLNSRGAYRLLAALDRDLASLPLDNGVRPLAVVEAPLQARLAETQQFLKKVSNRVKRKLRGGAFATLGSTSTSQLWHRHRLFERLPREPLLATGLFEPAAIDRIISGEWLPNRATLGFVILVAELCQTG